MSGFSGALKGRMDHAHWSSKGEKSSSRREKDDRVAEKRRSCASDSGARSICRKRESLNTFVGRGGRRKFKKEGRLPEEGGARLGASNRAREESIVPPTKAPLGEGPDSRRSKR